MNYKQLLRQTILFNKMATFIGKMDFETWENRIIKQLYLQEHPDLAQNLDLKQLLSLFKEGLTYQEAVEEIIAHDGAPKSLPLKY